MKAGASLAIPIGKGDQKIGDALIEYCDPAHIPGAQYTLCNAGGGQFKIRERLKP